jgi:hypothetical protein
MKVRKLAPEFVFHLRKEKRGTYHTQCLSDTIALILFGQRTHGVSAEFQTAVKFVLLTNPVSIKSTFGVRTINTFDLFLAITFFSIGSGVYSAFNRNEY